ncbi:tyrosine-type recombinase/integrase [Peribacillus muralis]|uniref:tyrosine-type recombinase/integrase n=1 Tax=Peribacillus muralis TaxID=264697 RepID=UPI003D083D8C
MYSGELPSKRIAKICKRGNIDPILLHDFRHSHVALLIELSEDISITREHLGHSSITTTIVTYGHLFPDRQQKLAKKLNSIL